MLVKLIFNSSAIRIQNQLTFVVNNVNIVIAKLTLTPKRFPLRVLFYLIDKYCNYKYHNIIVAYHVLQFIDFI